MFDPMTPTEIAEKARDMAEEAGPGPRAGALNSFANWIDEQERQRSSYRDNTIVKIVRDRSILSVTLTRGKVYDLVIKQMTAKRGSASYPRQEEVKRSLKGWVFDGVTGFSQSYLQFHKHNPERPWYGARREINRDNLVSATEQEA